MTKPPTLRCSLALGTLLVGGAILAVLFFGPEVAPRRQAEHAAIRSYLVWPPGADGALTFLSRRERSHLHDVKVLFDAAWILMAGSLAVLAASSRRLRAGPVAQATGVGLLVFLVAVGLIAALDFGRFWAWFHDVLFPEGNWRFPADSTIIRIYPQDYFERFVRDVVVGLVAAAVALIAVGRRVVGRTTLLASPGAPE